MRFRKLQALITLDGDDLLEMLRDLDRDEVFELICHLDDRFSEYEFTKRLRDHFDQILKDEDLVIGAEHGTN